MKKLNYELWRKILYCWNLRRRRHENKKKHLRIVDTLPNNYANWIHLPQRRPGYSHWMMAAVSQITQQARATPQIQSNLPAQLTTPATCIYSWSNPRHPQHHCIAFAQRTIIHRRPTTVAPNSAHYQSSPKTEEENRSSNRRKKKKRNRKWDKFNWSPPRYLRPDLRRSGAATEKINNAKCIIPHRTPHQFRIGWFVL